MLTSYTIKDYYTTYIEDYKDGKDGKYGVTAAEPISKVVEGAYIITLRDPYNGVVGVILKYPSLYRQYSYAPTISEL
jgi:hypothetical protein